MSLAIFDLDHTLLSGDSDHAWGDFLVEKGIVDGETFRRTNDAFYEDYKSGTLRIMDYLEFALEPLTRYSMQALATLHDEFMETCIANMFQPKAFALLEEHRRQGDFLLIITATNRFITAPIARHLGVDDLIATEPEVKNNRYTGKVVGTPTYQQGKVERLNQWLMHNPLDLKGSYFYSDSINDLALLEIADNPVVVDADPKLQAIAKTRKWPMISLQGQGLFKPPL